MKNRKIRVTPQALDQLIADVRNTPVQPVGEHLFSEEIIDYVMEELSPEQEARLNLHLASCEQCLKEIGRLADGIQAWHGAAGEQRLARLQKRIQEQLSLLPQGE